jgi:hypothetical protein
LSYLQRTKVYLHIWIISQVLNEFSPKIVKVPSTESQDTGDNFNIMEKENKNTFELEGPSISVNQMIGYMEPFYCCKQYPKVQNIHNDG